MVIILFAISPACTDDYEEGLQFSEEVLHANLSSYRTYHDGAGNCFWEDYAKLHVTCDGSRFTLTGVPNWIILDHYSLTSGPTDEYINYKVRANWSGETRKATLILTAFSSDGASLSSNCNITQESCDESYLLAKIGCGSSYNNSASVNGESGYIEVSLGYCGDHFELSTDAPDWITIENFDFPRQTDYKHYDDIKIYYEANNTGAQRVGTITFRAYLGDGRSISRPMHIWQSPL